MDLDTMIGVGLLVRTGRDVYMFNPAAGRYYEHVMTRRGRGFEAVEETVRRHLDAQRFSQRYPKTHRLLRQASAAVFSDDAHGKSTQVGHHIREALMEFTDELATRLGVALDAPANKTNDRLRTIIRSQRDSLGSRTIENYLDAMVGYWIGASHLAQRQEHGAQAERETLGWEDARRVVFGAMMLVYELDRALCRE